MRLILCDLKLYPDQNSLLFANYHTLAAYPAYVVSLSHCEGAGAALLADRKKFRSLGIDVENENRPVSPAVMEKISHPEQIKLRNIELWCAKEAVFKCLMNTGLFEQNVRFADINVQEKTWFHSPSSLSGSLELRRVEPFVLALATLST